VDVGTSSGAQTRARPHERPRQSDPRRDRLNDEQLPSGYANATIVLARLLTQSMNARPRRLPRNFARFAARLNRAVVERRRKFAPLRFDENVTMSLRPRGEGLRRARPSTTGSTMRYPSRLLPTSESVPSLVARRSTVDRDRRSVRIDGHRRGVVVDAASPCPRRSRGWLQPPSGRQRAHPQRVDHADRGSSRRRIRSATSATASTARYSRGRCAVGETPSRLSGSPTVKSLTRTTTPMTD